MIFFERLLLMFFNKNSTINQIFVLLNTNIVIAIMSYAFTLLLIREFSITEFGTYSYILIVGSFFSLLVSYSTEVSATTRFHQTEDIEEVILEIFSLRYITFIITFLISIFVGFYNLELAIGIIAISLVSLNLSFIYEIKLINKKYAYIYFAERFFYILISSFIVFFLDLSVLKLFSVLLLVTLISIIFQMKIWSAYTIRLDFKKGLTCMKYNTYLLFSSLAVYSYGGFSRIILENKLSLEDLAIYSAGWQFIMLITLFQTQIERIWRLKFSASIVGNDKTSFRNNLTKFFCFSTLPTLFIAILLFLFSESVIGFLFSDKYVSLVSIVPVFCFYFLVVNLDSLVKMIIVSLNSSIRYFSIHFITGLLLLSTLSLSSDFNLLDFSILIVTFHFSAVFLLFIITCFNTRFQRVCY